MTGLRSADLRFRRDETIEFLQNFPELGLADSDLTVLDEAVEGWPAGLRLASINLRLSDNPVETLAALELNHTFAAEYLFSEILAKLPEEQQVRLLKLAIVDRFCAGLCEAICEPPFGDLEWPGGDGFIQWLDASNIFLVALDHERVWFRFHHLFLQMLRGRMEATFDADARARLRRKAATWLAAAGNTEDALQLFLQAGDLDSAASVVGDARQHVINREDWPRLTRWLAQFPAEYIDGRPELQIIKAFAIQNMFRLPEVSQILGRIVTLYESVGGQVPLTDTNTLAVEIATLRAQNLFWIGDFPGSLKAARFVFEHAPAQHIGLISSAYLYMALSLQAAGGQTHAFTLITQSLAGHDARQNPQLTVRMLLAQTTMLWAAADLGATERSARQLLHVSTLHHLRASQSWGYYFLGCVCYWRNQLPEAAAHFGALVERPSGAHAMAAVQAHFGLSMTLLAQGQTVSAAEVLEAAFAVAAEMGGPALVRLVESFEAHLSLLGGKKAVAVSWADKNQEPGPILPMYFLEIPILTWAQVRIKHGGAGDARQAAAALETIRGYVKETHNVIRLIDALALEALLCVANGDQPAALAALQEALKLAEPGGILRPFVDLGPQMAALLREAARQPALGDFAGKVLAAFSGQGAEGAAWAAAESKGDGKVVEPLTNRELEVLALIGQRLSNKEIAQILVVSPVTVKAHARNLFAKLNASSRREAVTRAYSLGLLRPS